MKVSLSWLKNYVSVEGNAASLADSLTMAGLEVEAVYDRYDYLNKVVAGRLLEIVPHPDTDRLKICLVNVGDKNIQVVCGDLNIYVDMICPVALPGTVFPDGSILKKSLIRGKESNGMLCSASELGTGIDKNSVMILNQGIKPGEKLIKALNLSDMVLDISLTPNRPDCLSMIGVAREVAAIYNNKIILPDVKITTQNYEDEKHLPDLASVIIESPELCPRYAARLVKDIIVKPSPFWLQDKIISAGLRPVNNIVDITNFVMMETGQPLHAFDFDSLAQNKIIVKNAKDGEKFTTLDNKEHTLSSSVLMICDGEKPVAMAGVMGGMDSEIKDFTTSVLIESAYFNPASIRKTAKTYGFNTDASHRFERGVDPEGTVTALNRAASLMAEISGGTIVKGLIDNHTKKIKNSPITLGVKETNRLLGTDFTIDKIEFFLKSVEFKVKHKGHGEGVEKLIVTPPSFRVDVTRPVDLVEEVARLSGYDNIPVTFPKISSETGQDAIHAAKIIDFRYKLKGIMTGFGFSEAINYSFIHCLSCDRMKLCTTDPARNIVNIINPITEDQSVLRTSLIPGLLETMHKNISRQSTDLKLFETGNIFFSKGHESLPEEKEMLAGLWTGLKDRSSWHTKERKCDFFDIKGVVEGLLDSLNIKNTFFTKIPDNLCDYIRPGFSAAIFANNIAIGRVGEVHPEVILNYNLAQTTYIFEMDLNLVFSAIPEKTAYIPLPKFPAISRDITIIVDKDMESSDILLSVKNFKEDLVEKLYLFDMFEGKSIPTGKKSISFRITYRSSIETLKDDYTNQVHKIITDRLIKKFNAALPAQKV